VIDPKLLRSDPEAVARNLARRGFKLELSAYRALEELRKQSQIEADRLRSERNAIAKAVGIAKGKGEDAAALLERGEALTEDLANADRALMEVQRQLEEWQMTLPNLLHDSVPDGRDEAANAEIRVWGTRREFEFAPADHVSIGEQLAEMDFAAATKISGSRFVVLSGNVARLQRALIQFMLDVHTREHGYTEILPPFLVNSASLLAAGQLPKFAADLFKVQDTDFWLTPTSEVELHNLYRDETLPEDKLPLKVTAWTACFRSEAGAAGKDTRGILRQHQFQKVELFKFTHPEKSYEEHESLTRNAEAILQKLGLHYRTMLLCTGDMGFASAKTYDLEVWLPSSNEFREISSCSNCEAFQARRGGIRFKPKGGGKSEFVHTLNGSGLAVGRTWIAIVENYQQADGSIIVPDALRPYMGTDRIPAA